MFSCGAWNKSDGTDELMTRTGIRIARSPAAAVFYLVGSMVLAAEGAAARGAAQSSRPPALPSARPLPDSHHLRFGHRCRVRLWGVLPKLVKLTHGRLQVLISFVGGLMLGISVFHLLPHAMVELGGGQKIDAAMVALMCGMLSMFLLLRMFHFHDHGPAEVHDPHDHDHDHDGNCGPAIVPIELAYSGVTECLVVQVVSMHSGHSHGSHRELSGWGSVLDCRSTLCWMAWLSGPASKPELRIPWGLAGSVLATFLAILLHKPLDSVSIAGPLCERGNAPQTGDWR